MKKLESYRAGARLLGVTPATLRARVARGSLQPPPWTARQLHASQKKVGPAIEAGSHAEHGTVSRWDAGCDCKACHEAHLDDLVRRRRVRRQEMIAPHRSKILEILAGGGTFDEVWEATGIHQQALHALAEWDEQWRADFDYALMSGRRPDLAHGGASAYRAGCRCPECRGYKNSTRK